MSICVDAEFSRCEDVRSAREVESSALHRDVPADGKIRVLVDTDEPLTVMPLSRSRWITKLSAISIRRVVLRLMVPPELKKTRPRDELT